jgi:cobalamin biosynthesis protein CobD/CbiB
MISAVSGVSFLILELFESGDLTHIMPPMSVNAWILLLFNVLFLVSFVMAFLSQVLTDKANRWANIIVGAVMAIFPLVAFIGMVTLPSVMAINPLFGIIWSVLIVWTAWKSK